MIDVEKVRKRLLEIEANQEKLRRYIDLPEERFWEDERNIGMVKYLFLISVEAVASVSNHLMAKMLKKAVTSYAECFQGLQELGVFEDNLIEALVRMARMRNVLIHEYWEVDDRKIFRFVQANLNNSLVILESESFIYPMVGPSSKEAPILLYHHPFWSLLRRIRLTGGRANSLKRAENA